MGVFYALGSSALFALGNVFIRRGQRAYTADNGAVITAVINVLILGAVTAGLVLRAPIPWTAEGIVAFIVAGVLTTGLGRFSNMAAVRSLGPSRAGVYRVSAPVFTVGAAYIMLGERLTFKEAVGAAVVLAGLWVLTTEARAKNHDGSGAALEPAVTLPLRGIAYGLAAALFYGLGFVVRKVGLGHMPAVVPAAALGAAAGLATNLIIAWAGRGWAETVRTALREVPLWFKLAGFTTSVAVLGQFSALSRLSASVVSVLLATEPLWILVLGRLLFPGQETVTARVVISALMIVAGVGVMFVL